MLYAELIRIRFLTMLAYRLNYFSGILTYVVYTGGYYFLWQAIYSDRTDLGGLTAVQMSTYLVVSWMTRSFYFNNLDHEIAEEFKSGMVAVQLIRPYHYLLGKLVGGLGEGIFRLLFWMLPGMAVATFLFPVALPAAGATYGYWALASLLAFLVNALLNTAFGLFTFYLQSAQGLRWAKRLVVDLFSGLFLPLHLLPDWLQAVSAFLPFQAIAYLPNMIFAGGFSEGEVWRALGLQALWVVLLALANWALWRQARRYLVVQGG